MKLIMLMAFLVTCGSPALAQPPHGANKTTAPPCSEAWCDQARYKYVFCDGKGRFVYKCSSDPNHEPGAAPGDPPLTMVKKATPTVFRPCLNLASSKYGRIIVDPSSPVEWGTNTVVFDIFQMDSIATLTEYAWTHLCPPQGPSEEYQYCCMTIRFSTSDADFAPSPPDNVRMVTVLAGDGRQSPSHCGISCEGSAIIINQQLAFTDKTSNNVPVNFFYTDHRLNVPSGGSTYAYKYYSMYAHLLHEMGHWFGFAHANTPDDFGNACYHPGSIMEEGYIGDWQHDRHLTRDDECMFMKAYCCARTTNDVEEGLPEWSGELKFTLAPNPARSSTIVTFPALIPRDDAFMRVLALDGRQIMHHSLPGRPRSATLDVSSLPNGVYMVEVVAGTVVTGRTLMVQH